MSFANKSVVITGSASGIGKATATLLAAAGAHVYCADIDETGGTQAVAQMDCNGGSATFFRLDITDDASITEFAAAVNEAAAPLDILINAVGGGANEFFLKSDPQGMQRDVDLNYLGPVKLTHALLGPMSEAKQGKIVFVASDAGRVGSSGESVYAGAKGGIIAFTKSLAREVARANINVNCVCPGPTDTPLLRSRPEKMLDALIKAIPFHRFADPDEIAAAILFFAGSGSDYITGQVLSVSGGLTMAD